MKSLTTDSPDISIKFKGISILGCQILTGFSMDNPRISSNYKMILVLNEDVFCMYRDSEIKVSKGDILFIFPGVKYFYYSNSRKPWRILLLTFNGEQCEEFLLSMNITADKPFVFGFLLTEKIEKYLRTMIIANYDSNDDNHFESLACCYLILNMLMQKSASVKLEDTGNVDNNPIKKAVKYIEQNYHNKIDVDMICSHVNYSRSYFSRSFKKETEMSIPEYINYVRIQRAKFLLSNTDLYINEISKTVGFSDPFYFSKCFKKFTGCSPSEYIERLEKQPQAK